MRHRAATATVACLLVAATVAAPASATSSAGPGNDLSNELSSEHFVVEYADGDEAAAETTLSYLQEIRTSLLEELPVDSGPDERITVRIHPRDDWTRSPYSLHWHTRPYRINLIAPDDWVEVEDVDEYFVKKGLAHEYANILLHSWTEANSERSYHGGNPPWFAEGLSEYYAYHNVSEGIEQNYEPDGVNRLKEDVRGGSGYFSMMTQDRYSGGHLLAHYTLDTYGTNATFAVLSSDAETFAGALEDALGVSFETYTERWLVWAEANIGGEYDASEESVAREQEVDRLRTRLAEQNDTIEELRRELRQRNETVERLRRELNESATPTQTDASTTAVPDSEEPTVNATTASGESGGTAGTPALTGARFAAATLVAALVLLARRD